MFISSRVDVSTSAVLVVSGQSSRANVRNRGSAAVYLGDEDVTTSTGYQLDAGEAVSFDTMPNEEMYAIAASGTQTVHVLEGSGA